MLQVLKMQYCTFVHTNHPPALLPALTSLDIRNSSLESNSQATFLSVLDSCRHTLAKLCATLGTSHMPSPDAKYPDPRYGLLQWPWERVVLEAMLKAMPKLIDLSLVYIDGEYPLLSYV